MTAAWIAACASLAAALAAVKPLRWLWRLLRNTRHFLDDWIGEPPRDGVQARPGVMARLRALEDGLAKVLQETRPNGGTSLRDVVARTAADVSEIKHEQTLMRARMEVLESQRAGREENKP